MGKHMAKEHREFFAKPFKCPECVRQGNEGSELFVKKHWLDHLARRHPAHLSAGCLESADPGGFTTPPATPEDDDMDMASAETGLYRQLCGSSNASPSSSDTTFGGFATPDSLDDAVIGHLDHHKSTQMSKPELAGNKRKRDKQEDPESDIIQPVHRRRPARYNMRTVNIEFQQKVDSLVSRIDPELLKLG
jgi:hypothetical protein